MSDEALPSFVTQIEHENTTFYLLGTDHVSQDSVAAVRAVIDRVEPDVVCVELDEARLRDFDDANGETAFRSLDIFEVVRKGRGLYLLAYLALARYMRRIGAEQGDLAPGAELLAAVKVARERGIPVELIDRDIHITLTRMWKTLRPTERYKILVGLITRAYPKPPLFGAQDPKALSELLSAIPNFFPRLREPVIDERDRYLASKVHEVGAGKRRVVAVVGSSHVPGMRAVWGTPVDRPALEKLPGPRLVTQLLKWAVPALVIFGLWYFWQNSEETTFADMMLRWILPTSIGSGLLTLLARGHVLSVASALLIAPIGVIHPLIATGMVVGLVEAWRRKPGVVDLEHMPDDMRSLRGAFRNRATRILILVIASNVGAGLGFLVGVTYVVTS